MGSSNCFCVTKQKLGHGDDRIFSPCYFLKSTQRERGREEPKAATAAQRQVFVTARAGGARTDNPTGAGAESHVSSALADSQLIRHSCKLMRSARRSEGLIGWWATGAPDRRASWGPLLDRWALQLTWEAHNVFRYKQRQHWLIDCWQFFLQI